MERLIYRRPTAARASHLHDESGDEGKPDVQRQGSFYKSFLLKIAVEH